MKIAVAADLHICGEENLDYIKAFNGHVAKSQCNLVVILGDIINSIIKNNKSMEAIQFLFPRIYPIVRPSIPFKYGQEIELSPYEIVTQTPAIARYISTYSPHDVHRPWKEISTIYMGGLTDIFSELQNYYVEIANLVKSNKDTIIIPGNHDLDLEKTVLKNLNLHERTRTINGLKLSGYGGAAMRDGMPIFSGLPPELTTPFNEYPLTSMNEDGTLETRLVSEPMEFLEKEQPDIALLHTPIYGVLDLPADLRDNNEMPEAQKHLGSPGIREYAMTGKTKIFFSGHVHSDRGVKSFEAKNGSIVVAMNPGCLGNTEVRGGHFAEVLIDDNTKEFQSATFYEILPGGLVSPSATYVKRGRIVEPIIVTGAMPSDEMADAWLMEERAKKIRFR